MLPTISIGIFPSAAFVGRFTMTIGKLADFLFEELQSI
jgi:hypothetical protein